MRDTSDGLFPRALCRGALALLLAGGVAAAQDSPTTGPTLGASAGSAQSDEEAQGFFGEPRLLDRAIALTASRRDDRGPEPNGFYPELSNMPTGAGWITIGPGYRHWLLGDRAVIDGSAAVSWRAYKMAQARLEFPGLVHGRFTLGTQTRWQDLTQVTYFGSGPGTPVADRSEYRLKSTNVVGYATVHASRTLSATFRAGWLDGVSVLEPAGSFKRGNPGTREVFPDNPVFAIDRQPAYAYGEASVALDTRNHRGHPTRGGLYRVGWASYGDRAAGTFGFERSEAEAAHFVPLAASRVVLALHGWLVATDTSAGQLVPFYLEPSLGGHNTLRGYTDYRFHDRNAVVANLETRIALFTHVDAAVFADAGNVAARVADLDFGKRSYGIGMRVHSHETTFARLDLAHGSDGWRVLFRLSDPLHLSRTTRRTAAVPFVP